MFEFYGAELPNNLFSFEIGGICPHCKQAGKFTRLTIPQVGATTHHSIKTIVVDYGCIICRKNIPIMWQIVNVNGDQLTVTDPKLVLPSKETFDFEYVPDTVKKEIEEALDCLSVNAYNGFAAVCRRAIQSLCTNLGVGSSTRVQNQIEEMIEISGLGAEWKELARQIMFSGHDGSHPHLPDVNRERAEILISLLQDLTYQIYTRPGKVKAAAELRKEAIDDKKKNLNNEGSKT